jgi:hypothetical protein
MKKILFLGVVFLAAAGLVFGQAEDILKLKEKIIELQNKGELGFRNFAICSNIMGFGSYVPAAAPTFKSGDQIQFYYEPVNVFTGRRESLYEIWYTQDMIVADAKGNVLMEKVDAMDFHYTSKSPVLDLFVTGSLDLTSVPPGKYQYKAVLKDKLRNKQIVKAVDFTVK